MTKPKQPARERLRQRRSALARWENEGGADAGGAFGMEPGASGTPALANAELVRLRVRVIALENLVIALLANSSEEELGVARARAEYISPRPGFTAHALTLDAADQILRMAERSRRFRSLSRS